MNGKKINSKKYVSMAQAAEYAGLSEGTIRNLIAMRELTAYRPVPGRIVLDLEEIDRFVRDSEGQRSTRGRARWGGVQAPPIG
jgi:excisionase family DNA binding protein